MDLVKDSILKASVVTVLFLMLGLLIGLQFDDARTSFLEDQIRESNLKSETFLVTQSYLEDSSKNYCRVTKKQIPELASENARIGQDLQSFSGKSFGNEDRFDYLKRKYYVNQLKLYMMLQGYQKKCDKNVTTVFFFFDSSVDSKRQGAVLTEYRRKVSNRTYVFSYNLNTEDSTVLEMLKTDYEIEEGPAIVIDGNRTIKRYVPLNELKQIL